MKFIFLFLSFFSLMLYIEEATFSCLLSFTREFLKKKSFTREEKKSRDEIRRNEKKVGGKFVDKIKL